MDFFKTIFVSIATLFGFGGAVDVPEPLPVTASSEVMAEEVTMEEENDSSGESEVVELTEPATSTSDAEVEITNQEPTMTSNNTTPAVPVTPNIQTMLVAGGCFWCVESDLEKTPGVLEAVSGYAGGTSENPTYDDYGKGGHREVVEVTYDANQISFEEVLIVTMKTTDPTDDDGTFADRGDKYSAAFYYETPAQKATIDALIADVNANGPYQAPLAIDIESRPKFWAAEDFHQDYYKGTLSALKYKYYRTASGRDRFIAENWGSDTSPTLLWRNQTTAMNNTYSWSEYQKPSNEVLKGQLDELAYKVTQEDGTERAGSSPLDKVYERGVYVDILSGEPLFSSRDKFDSLTGWPSFTQPIFEGAVTEYEDKKLFSTRTEIRSVFADNHIGHVFNDGPNDRGGLRYCMNGVALRFVPEAEMDAAGYSDFVQYL